jgi:hypothetical protein
MKSGLERLRSEVALPSFKGLSEIFFKGAENLSQDSRSLNRELNPGSHKSDNRGILFGCHCTDNYTNVIVFFFGILL